MDFQQRPTSSYHQPCDTFFVESYDDYRVPRMDPKEHARLIARERQYAMADELSQVTSDELRDDIMLHMLDMEVSLCLLWISCVGFMWMLMVGIYRLLPFLMSNRLISKPRSNGSCALICWTS